jgi:hypothetical protein
MTSWSGLAHRARQGEGEPSGGCNGAGGAAHTSHHVVTPTTVDGANTGAPADPAIRNLLISQGYQEVAPGKRAAGGGTDGGVFAT